MCLPGARGNRIQINISRIIPGRRIIRPLGYSIPKSDYSPHRHLPAIGEIAIPTQKAYGENYVV